MKDNPIFFLGWDESSGVDANAFALIERDAGKTHIVSLAIEHGIKVEEFLTGEYKAALEEITEEERNRLLYGSWKLEGLTENHKPDYHSRRNKSDRKRNKKDRWR